MGGIGKTQTALEYCYANRDSCRRIYWITAVNQESLLSGYKKIATKARIEPSLSSLDSKPVEIAESVISWLHKQRSWLLVIDNLDYIDVVAGLLPQNGAHQHTLITTRDPNTAGIPADGLEVPLLNVADSVDLLCTLSNIDNVTISSEHKQAVQIVEELGHLPLGIEQAAAYVREAAGDFATFLEHYTKIRPQLYKWVPQGSRQYSFSLATTWSMSFNIVRKSDPKAAKLFQLLSFLNPDDIPIDFLVSAAQVLDNDLRMVVSNPIDRAKALIGLEKFSLLKWNRLTQTLVIHRLVQAVIKDEMSEQEQLILCNTVINVCDEAFPNDWNNDTRALCRVYFGQIVAPLLSIKSIRTLKLADIMERVGNFLRHDGKFNDSAKLLSEVIQIRTSLSGRDDPSTLTSMGNLTLTYWKQNRLNDAADLEKEVLEKRKKILGYDHPDTLTSINNLASTYQQLGRLDEAVKLQDEVFEKMKIVLGDFHPNTLASMNNLALTCREQGRLDEAAKLQEEVFEKMKKILGEDDPDTLTSMNNLAYTYVPLGRLHEAAKLEEEVLEKRKKIQGDDHPDTVISMNNLSGTYGKQGRWDKAAKLQEEILDIRMKMLGHDHPLTVVTMINLASTYEEQRRLDEAAKLQEEVLEKMKKIIGEDNVGTLSSMHKLASTYGQQGRLDEAAKLQEEVLEKMKKIVGEDHPDTLMIMNHLTSTYRQQGRLDEAAKLQEEWLEKIKILGIPENLASISK